MSNREILPAGGPSDTTGHVSIIAGVAATGREVYHTLTEGITPAEAVDSTRYVQIIAEMNALDVSSPGAVLAAGTVATTSFLNSTRMTPYTERGAERNARRPEETRTRKAASWLVTAGIAGLAYKVGETVPPAVAFSTAFASTVASSIYRTTHNIRARNRRARRATELSPVDELVSDLRWPEDNRILVGPDST